MNLSFGLVLSICMIHSASAASIQTIAVQSRALASKTALEAKETQLRWAHAKELLGKSYKKSIVKSGEEIAELDDILNQWTYKALKGRWKKYSSAITNTILEESRKHGFDPIFLMAVIENESSFNPEVVGQFGEIGLMQITPQTAQWIAKKYDLPFQGKSSLTDPVTNIKIGSAYLAFLREKFDFHSQLYLAAYNMGSANVKRAIDRQIWPKDYPSRVMHRYVKFYSELSEEVKRAFN